MADADYLLVSVSELVPGSASANLQVGSRMFAVTVVDSGGATVTRFSAPIVVTATLATSGIAALEPVSGVFRSITTNAQPGQVTGALTTLAAPPTSGLSEPGLAIASTGGATDTAAAPASWMDASQPSSVDPIQILQSLGLLP